MIGKTLCTLVLKIFTGGAKATECGKILEVLTTLFYLHIKVFFFS